MAKIGDRNSNIALAISDGKTTNIPSACDMFYGNATPSVTIQEAIAKGVAAGSPYKSLDDILNSEISTPSVSVEKKTTKKTKAKKTAVE